VKHGGLDHGHDHNRKRRFALAIIQKMLEADVNHGFDLAVFNLPPILHLKEDFIDFRNSS